MRQPPPARPPAKLTLSNGKSQFKFQLTGTGASGVVFSPGDASFGDVGIGTTSTAIKITWHNYGHSAATFKSSSGLPPFKIEGGNCPLPDNGKKLEAGESCTFDAEFAPAKSGSSSGEIVLIAWPWARRRWRRRHRTTVTVSADNLSALSPSAPLSTNSEYVVFLCGYADIAGIQGSCFESSFYTGTNSVTSPLLVSTISPANGQTGVPQNARSSR